MTDEELAAIRQALDKPEVMLDEAIWTLNQLVPPLIDENAAMREIVQAVAQVDWDECDGHWACPLGCTGKFTGDDTQVPPDLQHEPDCPVTKARALLGTD